MLDRQKTTTDVDSVFWQEWQKYQDYLYHCCLKWMEGNSTEAEDALSIAMLKAREKMGKNVQPIDNFKAWLTTITHNLCMDILKHNNHCIVGFEDADAMCCCANNTLSLEGVSQGENPVLAATQQELENFLDLAIDDLPGRLQETFKLYFQEEHSYQQIATELHISCPNVRKRISQARAILHKHLDEYEGTGEKTVFESGKKEKSEPEELPEEIVVAETSQEEVLPGEVQLSVALLHESSDRNTPPVRS
ncbi:MAG: sigma-70 family RNA polymerase sigma factor [Microcoleaceae cyanobacterium MO_207.B10]|nr:sigma-70 family RNA polymerase sigma factor [Microcoleaceae cyanobacterium MO_207.B10]